MDPNNPYQPPNTDLSPPDTGETDQTSPFSASGRFGRLSFIAWGLVIGLLSNLVSLVLGGSQMFIPHMDPSGNPVPPDISGVALAALIVITLIFFVFYIIFTIRRCHDFNASGWWTLLVIVPIANLIFFLFLWLKPGTMGANNYGPPRVTPGWEKVVGIIGVVFIVIAIVGIIAAIVVPLMMAPTS